LIEPRTYVVHLAAANNSYNYGVSSHYLKQCTMQLSQEQLGIFYVSIWFSSALDSKLHYENLNFKLHVLSTNPSAIFQNNLIFSTNIIVY
jgi:hypothetical protein